MSYIVSCCWIFIIIKTNYYDSQNYSINNFIIINIIVITIKITAIIITIIKITTIIITTINYYFLKFKNYFSKNIMIAFNLKL